MGYCVSKATLNCKQNTWCNTWWMALYSWTIQELVSAVSFENLLFITRPGHILYMECQFRHSYGRTYKAQLSSKRKRTDADFPRRYLFCGSFMFLFCLVFAMSLCASVYMCFVVTCWERADLLALVCGVYCEFVTFPLVSWVRCGTWLYRFLIFAPLPTFIWIKDRMLL